MRPTLLVLACAFALSAGCLAGTPSKGTLPIDLPDLVPASEPLWWNPATEPHPAFNFPTLTRPANGTNLPWYWNPIPALALPNPINGISHVIKGDAPSGSGMSVFGSLAVVPGYGKDTTIFNITNPTTPTIAGKIVAPKKLDGNQMGYRNVDFLPYPDGRLMVIFSTGSSQLHVWNITDPAHAELVSILGPGRTHKVNVVPGTPIVYNANSRGSSGNGTQIYNLTNPEEPIGPITFENGYGCHHIYFWLNPKIEKYRAICAGDEVTQLWDIKDPMNPKVVVSVPVVHGDPNNPLSGNTLVWSHFAGLNYDGDVLLVGDEWGGGGSPPGCIAHAGTGPAQTSTPFGALWFYDVSTETKPVLKGWFSPGTSAVENDASNTCTAHHGRLVPDPQKRDMIAMAFYGAGVALIDFSDPTTPKLLDQFNDGTDTWEVQYYNGYLFTGDLNRGMDVFKFR